MQIWRFLHDRNQKFWKKCLTQIHNNTNIQDFQRISGQVEYKKIQNNIQLVQRKMASSADYQSQKKASSVKIWIRLPLREAFYGKWEINDE